MRIFYLLCMAIFMALASVSGAWAHFGMVIPQQNIVERPGEVEVEFRFWHPMEGDGMDLAKPQEAGVYIDGKKTSLLTELSPEKIKGLSAWEAKYQIKRPGDYYFYMIPQPYWEPAEDCFIVHYTKSPVSAMGAEEGWDRPLGLKMEIIPLTRPYGLYAGNSFTGRVLYKGKSLAGSEVEVEFFNEKGRKKTPTDSHITQVVKTDDRGLFTYTLPWAGWWGFAALHTDEDRKIKLNGQDKDVEVGGVLWIYAH